MIAINQNISENITSRSYFNRLLISGSLIAVVIAVLNNYKKRKVVSTEDMRYSPTEILDKYIERNEIIKIMKKDSEDLNYFYTKIYRNIYENDILNMVMSYISFLENKNKIIEEEIKDIQNSWFFRSEKEKNYNIIHMKRALIEKNKNIIKDLRRKSNIQEILPQISNIIKDEPKGIENTIKKEKIPGLNMDLDHTKKNSPKKTDNLKIIHNRQSSGDLQYRNSEHNMIISKARELYPNKNSSQMRINFQDQNNNEILKFSQKPQFQQSNFRNSDNYFEQKAIDNQQQNFHEPKSILFRLFDGNENEQEKSNRQVSIYHQEVILQPSSIFQQPEFQYQEEPSENDSNNSSDEINENFQIKCDEVFKKKNQIEEKIIKLNQNNPRLQEFIGKYEEIEKKSQEDRNLDYGSAHFFDNDNRENKTALLDNLMEEYNKLDRDLDNS